MKKIHKKLVRDKVPEYLEKKGITVDYNLLSSKEKTTHLREKLREEVQEVYEAKSNELAEEIADVIEVIICLSDQNDNDITFDPILHTFSHKDEVGKLKNDLLNEVNNLSSLTTNEVEYILYSIKEILSKIAFSEGINAKEIEGYRIQKLKERGSFNDGIFLISTEE